MNFAFRRQTDLALSALRVLAQRRVAVPGSELAEELGTTTSYLPQVMAPLVKAGWVESHRGPGGGYRITADSTEVSIRDVIDATEESITTGRCVMRDQPCPGAEACRVHGIWQEARNVLIDGLDTIPAITSKRRTS